MAEPLVRRRELLEREVLPNLSEPVRYSPELRASLTDLIQSVKAQRLEGLVAKNRNSRYEPGQRSGAWQKMRINQGQEFVIGGYTVGGSTFDALVFGYYESGKLVYAARTRNGFTPRLRAELMKRFVPLETRTCPFRKPAREEGRQMGRGINGCEDGGLPLASAFAGRAVRICGVDSGGSPPSQPVPRATRGQGRQRRQAGVQLEKAKGLLVCR